MTCPTTLKLNKVFDLLIINERRKGKKMGESGKGIAITLALLLGIFLQILFVFVDEQNTPNKAAVEFAEAYFCFDGKGMTQWIGEEARVVDDVDMIGQHLHRGQEKARTLGYSLYYMKEKLYHVKTKTLSKDAEKAKIRLTAERKPPLQSFFTGRSDEVDETLTVKKEGGKWKVCGSPFSLHEG